jgi:tetratricopeptide (TPR) repeat protein
VESDHHYSREELWEAYLGYLSSERRTAIWLHVGGGCCVCVQRAFELLDELLGDPPDLAEEPCEVDKETGRPPDLYDLAIERALVASLKVTGNLRKERAKLPEAMDLLTQKGAQVFGREAPARLRGLAGVEALLQKSWEARYEDPHEMVFQANLASVWAQRLDPARYGHPFVRDLQCRTLIELGNAHRVADELEEAQKILDHAAHLISDGAGDDLLEARLCDVQASLHAARRFFSASCGALDTVHAIHQRRGDHHLAGRALISKGVYTGYQGNTEEAEKLIRRGLDLVDRDREPSLFVTAVHNLIYLVVEQGRFREARTFLFRHRPYCLEVGWRINLLKLRALEGRIAAGLGKFDQAETIFREVREGFRAERLGYKAALAALELAVVLQKTGRDAEARDVILETTDVFLSLKVHREAMAAMLVLRKACESDVATTALMRSTIYFLTQAEDNPTLAAEDFLAP